MSSRPTRRLPSGLSLWLTLALLLGQPLGWLHGLGHLTAQGARAEARAAGQHTESDGHAAADVLCLQCLAHAPLGAALPPAPLRWHALGLAQAAPQAAAQPSWAAPACAPCARDPPARLG